MGPAMGYGHCSFNACACQTRHGATLRCIRADNCWPEGSAVFLPKGPGQLLDKGLGASTACKVSLSRTIALFNRAPRVCVVLPRAGALKCAITALEPAGSLGEGTCGSVPCSTSPAACVCSNISCTRSRCGRLLLLLTTVFAPLLLRLPLLPLLLPPMTQPPEPLDCVQASGVSRAAATGDQQQRRKHATVLSCLL